MRKRSLICLVYALSVMLAACGPARLESAPQPLPSPAENWKIKLQQSGGFAGVSLNVEVSSDGRLVAENTRAKRSVTQDLSPDKLAQVQRLYAKALAITQPRKNTLCADCFLYTLDVSGGGGSKQVKLDDTTMADSGAAELIGLLQQLRDEALRTAP